MHQLEYMGLLKSTDGTDDLSSKDKKKGLKKTYWVITAAGKQFVAANNRKVMTAIKKLGWLYGFGKN